MNADPEFDAALGLQASVALDHAVLHLYGATHGVDHAAELDKNAVSGPLDDAPVVRVDGGIDQVAAQTPQPRQSAILVRAGEPAVADHVGDQDRRDLSRFRHAAPSGVVSITQKRRDPRTCLSLSSNFDVYARLECPTVAHPDRVQSALILTTGPPRALKTL